MYANYTLRAHSPPHSTSLPISLCSQHALTRVDLLSTLSQSPLNVTNRFQTRYSIQCFSASISHFVYPAHLLLLLELLPQFVTLWRQAEALFLALWPSNAHFLNFSTLIVSRFSVVCIIFVSFRTLSILTSYLTDWNSANLSTLALLRCGRAQLVLENALNLICGNLCST